MMNNALHAIIDAGFLPFPYRLDLNKPDRSDWTKKVLSFKHGRKKKYWKIKFRREDAMKRHFMEVYNCYVVNQGFHIVFLFQNGHKPLYHLLDNDWCVACMNDTWPIARHPCIFVTKEAYEQVRQWLKNSCPMTASDEFKELFEAELFFQEMLERYENLGDNSLKNN